MKTPILCDYGLTTTQVVLLLQQLSHSTVHIQATSVIFHEHSDNDLLPMDVQYLNATIKQVHIQSQPQPINEYKPLPQSKLVAPKDNNDSSSIPINHYLHHLIPPLLQHKYCEQLIQSNTSQPLKQNHYHLVSNIVLPLVVRGHIQSLQKDIVVQHLYLQHRSSLV